MPVYEPNDVVNVMLCGREREGLRIVMLKSWDAEMDVYYGECLATGHNLIVHPHEIRGKTTSR